MILFFSLSVIIFNHPNGQKNDILFFPLSSFSFNFQTENLRSFSRFSSRFFNVAEAGSNYGQFPKRRLQTNEL